jgi:epoxyqueuosine reductase
MSATSDALNFESCRSELDGLARKGGAVICGVADATAFTDAPEGHRPTDLLPKARTVYVVGGAQPRAGDWQSPVYQHMETTSFGDRMHSLAQRLSRVIEDQYGYYAICVPPGTDKGNQAFVNFSYAAELAGCGTKSLAGPVLNSEYGFMYYSVVITTLPLQVDGPLNEPVCPAPECKDMWDAEGTTPCMSTCPIDNGGCIGGKLEEGRIVERKYDEARCRTRVETYWVPGFQKVLDKTLKETDKEQQKMMLYSSLFSRTLWSMTYSNISQGQCFECMRVCPVGSKHRLKK